MGYLITKAFTEGISTTEVVLKNSSPIRFAFDDYEQICFEIEKTANEKTIV